MALGIAEANTVTTKNFSKKKVNMNQVYEDDPFLSKVMRNNKLVTRGGTSVQFPIRYRKYSKADAVGPDQQIAFGAKTTRTGADIEWKYYSTDTMVTWQERVENKGKPQVIDLMADKMEELMQDMMDRLATDLYTTNPNGLGFHSLAEIVDSAASYAGIAVADAAAWAGKEDGSTTELVLYGSNSLSYQMNQATFGRYSPDIIVTTKDLASKFESLVEPQQRYQDKDTADAGFKNVTFHGVPVLGNPFVPSSAMYALTSRVFSFRVDPEFNLDVTDWEDLFAAGFPRAFGKVMSLVCNLQCEMRKCNVKWTALDYTK